MAKLYNESTYLGLLFESNIAEYEMDVYAYLSNTRYKYIVIKNDQHAIIRQMGMAGLGLNAGGPLSSASASAQMQLFTRTQQNENLEIKYILQNIHRMHTETLLNPFYQADYVIQEEGQDQTIFTEDNVQKEVTKINAVEDILLDDFSLGEDDDSSNSGADDELKRTSSVASVDSNNSFNIRRTKGKQLLVTHTNNCLETLAIKIDQLVIEFEDKASANSKSVSQSAGQGFQDLSQGSSRQIN